MKKLILSLSIILCTVAAQAQFILGLKWAMGDAFQSKPAPSTGIQKNDAKPWLAYQVGFTGEYRFKKNFSLTSGLLLSGKGGKTESLYQNVTFNSSAGLSVMTASFKGQNNLNYMEIPLNLVYNLNAGNGHFFVGPGGYVGAFIGGGTKGTVNLQNMASSSPNFTTITGVYYGSIIYNPSSGEPVPTPQQAINPDKKAHAKGIDAGGNVTLGYSFNWGLQFSLNYSHGFTETNYGKNRTATIAVGYQIRRQH